MILLVMIDLIITMALAGIGGVLGLIFTLAGFPSFLLWFMPLWFGCTMPAVRFWIGYPSSRPTRRPDLPRRVKGNARSGSL